MQIFIWTSPAHWTWVCAIIQKNIGNRRKRRNEKTIIKLCTGTAIEDLGLPNILTATVKTSVTDDSGVLEEPVQDSGNPDEVSVSGNLTVATTSSAMETETNEPQEQEKEEETVPRWEEKMTDIPVTWEAMPEYQGNEIYHLIMLLSSVKDWNKSNQ